MNTTIHWLTTAFDGLVAFLPNLIAGLVILLVGWLIAAIGRIAQSWWDRRSTVIGPVPGQPPTGRVEVSA